MNRQEMLKLQYRKRRYMQHITDQELEQRAKDILLNQLVLTEDNKIGLHPIKKEGAYWATAFIHLLEEYNIRFGPYPAGFKRGLIKDVGFPDPELDTASKACDAVKKLKIEPNKYLFRYSKLKWLKETQEKGIIRVSPASSYSDPSLNPAIQDDEIRLTFQPTKEIKIVQEAVSDYYVYCLTSILIPRLFLDFDADAVLLIREHEKFISKIINFFEIKNPGWFGVVKYVKYLDPLNSSPNQTDILSCKHFRYSYQKEVRIIWMPSEPAKELQHQFIELGSLEDCSELICIKE